ncbi:MAG: hydantoinase/oxoprolinase family protein, partial [Desulfobacterales bacterium]|nr:hydantoinase/oxoprolinase family protein [Desulfobacterales bacterium]
LVDESLSLTMESEISGYPIKVPMIDIYTVGAGGGSIASMDVGGSLKVGPESAGADPGPICYGKGNHITV